MRPSFLLLTVVCCALAFSLALNSGQLFEHWLMWPIFLAALLAHISVNSLNEYQDFESGLDLKTVKTAFSGGSGALPENPQAKVAVLASAIISLFMSAGLGLFLLIYQGAFLLLPGIIGILIIVSYTRWINRVPWLCLFAPGMGFGLIMVTGSYLALTGEVNIKIALLSLVPFFLVNNLLLLNQYPDIEADRAVGRNHFPIHYGVSKSNRAYLLSLFSVIFVIAYMVLNQQLPWSSLFALLPLLLGFFAYSGAIKYRANIAQHPQYLAANVGVALLTPLVLSFSIYFST